MRSSDGVHLHCVHTRLDRAGVGKRKRVEKELGKTCYLDMRGLGLKRTIRMFILVL